MTAMLLYRIASVLLLLFAIGNAFVFRRTEPGWGVVTVDPERSCGIVEVSSSLN
jgi:hypothetical protein